MIFSVLTAVSAPTHDSQIAIPSTKMRSERGTNLYNVMDFAYDAPQIHDMNQQLEQIPLINMHPHQDKTLSDELMAKKKCCQLVQHKNRQPDNDFSYLETTPNDYNKVSLWIIWTTMPGL